ncbi:MAG TPA: peptidoglycan DD-metalloendopeptidase family protein [Candidatus Faecousia intestinavium]|nr:peptidoglycan DD-metalloendopeptidase family protein [Candidatus Faecousia intestinavium]
MRRNRKARSLLALLLAGALTVGMVPMSARAASSSEIQKEIDALEEQNAAIQRELDAIQSQYDENYSNMASTVEQKAAIDQEMTLLSNKIATTNEQIAAYSQMIADTQDQLEKAQEELRDLSEQHRERIRVMEEKGNLTYWEVIFEANSFMDLLDRLNMVEEINEADRKRIEEMRIASDLVTATQLTLESEKQTLEESRVQLAADEEALEEKRAESDELLRELEKQSEEYERLMAESEILQDELMLEIAAKEKELAAAKYDEYLAKLALQGENPPSDATWVTPVSGYTLTSPFGMRVHPILGTSRMHNGIDMACAQGTPIYATRAGTVTVASYQAGGAGNYVSINHLDGFASIYMHMTNYVVSAGQSVSQGQLIGYVGSTGLSTGPHLHFGISYAGTYVNPLAYIY